MPSEWRRGEQVGSRGQGETLPDKAVTPFNTSTRPVISSYVYFTLKLADPAGRPTLTPPCDSPYLPPHCTIILQLLSIDPSCHPGLHP
ncbi:hypothetical protein NQZ68_004773 [Dissostichus eleginoides]|nr:hypothetical protein NQZ68_004773 [Dissostichus eleginoides]